MIDCQKDCLIALYNRPCGDHTEKDKHKGNISTSGNSLVHKSLEIGKAIAAKGKLTMKASGTCMYPNVRNGDILHIEPACAAEMNVGDIAICRKPAYMFAHRVVAKGDDGAKPFIVTRADRNHHCNDGRTCDENLLGRVSRIERKGRKVSIEARKYALSGKVFYETLLKLTGNWEKFRTEFPEMLTPLQESGFYRMLAGLWWSLNKSRAEYSIHIPLHPEKKGSFFKKMQIEDTDGSFLEPDKTDTINMFKLVLILTNRKFPAASLILVRSPEDCVMKGWWVDDVHIRVRYRGTGIENELFEKTASILKNYGLNLYWRQQNI